MLRPSDSPMKVGVIGTGHVGTISCLSLASVGHRVVGCDADSEKVNALANGRMPFHEPGAQDLLKGQLAGDRLTFTPEIAAAVSDAEVVFETDMASAELAKHACIRTIGAGATRAL